MNAPLIDWQRPDWGGHVTIASWAPDAHDVSEAVES